jgi:hypothetical protein
LRQASGQELYFCLSGVAYKDSHCDIAFGEVRLPGDARLRRRINVALRIDFGGTLIGTRDLTDIKYLSDWRGETT